VFANFEYFDVATLHLLTINLYDAEGHYNSLPAGSRGGRARRTIFEHSNEFIFEQRTGLDGLKKKHQHEHHIHVLCAFPNRCSDTAGSLQQGGR
jgi:hypothetical protein